MDIIKELTKILEKEGDAIKNMKPIGFEKALLQINATKGKVITTGMGKAGIAAKKLSATLCSIGIVSSFLHPGDSQHGDLGILHPDDCLIVFSNSGRTDEVIETVRLSKDIGISVIIAITSNPESPLADICTGLIDIGDHEEADPWHLLPTVSFLMMCSTGDAISILLLRMRNVPKSVFAMRHHGGYLGHK